MWTKPAATEIRFGFKVTMYVCNRQVANQYGAQPSGCKPIKSASTKSIEAASIKTTSTGGVFCYGSLAVPVNC